MVADLLTAADLGVQPSDIEEALALVSDSFADLANGVPPGAVNTLVVVRFAGEIDMAKWGPEIRIGHEVLDERARQDAKFGAQWGLPDYPPDPEGRQYLVGCGVQLEAASRYELRTAPCWAAILGEEVGEALQETDPRKLRHELVQVSAVAQAWVRALDLREAR